MPKVERDIKIDKNIPFPERELGRKRSPYPWREISKGESFVFNGTVTNAQAAATYYSKATDKTFRARVYNGHVRVWRID